MFLSDEFPSPRGLAINVATIMRYWAGVKEEDWQYLACYILTFGMYVGLRPTLLLLISASSSQLIQRGCTEQLDNWRCTLLYHIHT